MDQQRAIDEGALMTVTRVIAAAAMLAGLAVGTAAPAWAGPTMSGHYIYTEPEPPPMSTDWYFTPCGDGCASVATTPGGSAFGQARLVNGQWTLDEPSSDITCSDGRVIRNAVSDHYTWDANTLAGTAQKTLTVQGCFNPAGYQYTNKIQLKQAPESGSHP
jgi:hypothetical protein